MASLYGAGAPATSGSGFGAKPLAFTNNPFLNALTALDPGSAGLHEPTPLLPANQAAPAAESVEVTALWGTTVLAVAQLTPPRKYAIGEVGGAHGAGTSRAGDVDFALSSERLGTERRELVTLRAGAPFVVFSSNEAPRVLENGTAVDISAGIVDCSDVALGARGIELRQGRVVIIEACGVTFRIAGSEKPASVPRAVLGAVDRTAATTIGAAALLQGLLVASLAYFTPSMAWGADDELERDRLHLMQQYLHASAEREREEPPQPADAGGGEQGAPAERSRGPEGKAGSPTAKQAGRMAIQGATAERVMSRSEMLKEAQDFGTIGLLNMLNASNAPSSPWGDIASGPDNVNAVGDLFSANIGEGIGAGGLGISGLGSGAGGKGLGVGMGNIGTCMGLNCYGNGDGGFARSVGRSGGGERKQFQFQVRPGRTEVNGRLPPEVIQRIVRQNYGRFRQCYEVGLRANPNLEGRVTARFVIGSDGAVSNVSAGGDLPDAQVKSCVASAFYGLSFPTPEGGIVTVSYPIMLMPG